MKGKCRVPQLKSNEFRTGAIDRKLRDYAEYLEEGGTFYPPPEISPERLIRIATKFRKLMAQGK